MGKGKGKKKAKPSAPDNIARQTDDQHDATTLDNRAMDGHNVEGWTASQVKAYNELLVEREKLVKQRKELEQKSAKSQAGRALLNENSANIDRVFERRKSHGDYKFIGKTLCCVDIDSHENCDHEICKRAKTKGLTYKELDIIKFYHMRIVSGKSNRMRNALRKQRDLELIKTKKDEEEKTKTPKKQTRQASFTTGDLSTHNNNSRHAIAAAEMDNDAIAGATEETHRLVTNILEQLDHLRTELQNGQITNSEMQKQLDVIDAEMHSAQIPTDNLPTIQELYDKKLSSDSTKSSSKTSSQNHLAQHLVDAKVGTYTKAFNIMEHFLSASKPGEFRRAVADLKNGLGMSGPMCDELQSSFDALEGIFGDPDRLSFTGPDGKHEYTSIIELMEKMKDTLQKSGRLPEGANADLTKVFQQCIDLEKEGVSQLKAQYEKSMGANEEEDLPTKLSDIRAAIVSKSPIPPLTERVLGEQIESMVAKRDVLVLVAKARSGIEIPAFDAFLTSFVMNRSNKDPQKCMETMKKLANTYAEYKEQHDCPMVEEAFPRIEAKITSFFAKLTEKKAKKTQNQQTTSRPPALPQPDPGGSLDILDRLPTDTADIVENAINKFTSKDQESRAHLSLKDLIRTYGSSSLWPIWLLYSERTNFFEDTALQEKSRWYADQIDYIKSPSNGELTTVIVFLFKSNVCPGMTAAIVSEVLAGIAEVDPMSANTFLHELSRCIESLPSYIPSAWSIVFQRLAHIMLQLYVTLRVNAALQFPKIQSADFALSTVAMLTNYVCLVGSAGLALHNLRLICCFLNTCMSPDGLLPINEVKEAVLNYEFFCRDDSYRCVTLRPCPQHFDIRALSEAQNIKQERESQGSGGAGANRSELSSTSHTTPSLAQTSQPRLLTVPNSHQLLEATVLPSPRLRANNQRSHRLRQSYTDYYNRAMAIYLRVARKAWGHILLSSQTSVSTNASDAIDILQPERNSLTLHSSDARTDKPGSNDRKKYMAKSKFSEMIDERHASVAHSAPIITRPLVTAVDAIGDTHPAHETKKAVHSVENLSLTKSPTYTIFSTTPSIDGKPNGTGTLGTTTVLSSTMKVPQDKVASGENQVDWTTNIIKLVLEKLGHTTPNVTALRDLALNDFYTFEKYAASLASESLGRGRPSDHFKQLCDNIYDSLSDGNLTTDSRDIKEFSKYALQDWKERTKQTIQTLPSSASQGEQTKVDSSIKDSVFASEAVSVTNPISETSTTTKSEKKSRGGNQSVLYRTTNPQEPPTRTERFQDLLINNIECFLSDLEDLKRIRTELMHFGNQVVSKTNEFDIFNDVFDDMFDGLQQNKGIVLGVAGVIAKNKDMRLLEDFLVDAAISKPDSRVITNAGLGRARFLRPGRVFMTRRTTEYDPKRTSEPASREGVQDLSEYTVMDFFSR